MPPGEKARVSEASGGSSRDAASAAAASVLATNRNAQTMAHTMIGRTSRQPTPLKRAPATDPITTCTSATTQYGTAAAVRPLPCAAALGTSAGSIRSEEHTSELQSRENLVC